MPTLNTLASDNFNRANENPLAAPWVHPSAQTSRFQLLSNVVQGITSNAHCAAYYSGPSWPNDQWSQATVVTLNNGDVGLAVRISPTAETYYLYTHCTAGNGGPILEAITAGLTNVLVNNAADNSAADGDVLRLEVSGSTVTVYVNNVQTMTATDSTITTGSPGISRFNITSPLDLWSGGSFITGPGNDVLAYMMLV